jgi:hypothetical protein
MTEYLNLCQGGANASACLGKMMKNDDTSVEYVTCIGGCDDFSLVLRTDEDLFIAHSM